MPTVRNAVLMLFVLGSLSGKQVFGQLNDVTQTPNAAGVGIKKSLEEQVGAGRGHSALPNSSLYLIQRDPFRSIMRGRQLFQRKFTLAQGLGPRTNDGVGENLATDASLGAGLADSCAACHGRPRGAAGFGGDVFTRPDSRDAPHLFGLGLQEMLADEITTQLRLIRARALERAAARGRPVRMRLRSKGIDYGTLRASPDGSVDTRRVRGVDSDLRVRPFFAEGATISIREFVVGAFNAEMGLEAYDAELLEAANGGRFVTPAGMVLDGTLDDIEAPPVSSLTEDSDDDGVSDEIPTSLVDHMEFYLLNYFKPATYKRTRETERGKVLFKDIGCARCHVPDLLIQNDRRVADVETVFDPERGAFNRLFAEAIALYEESEDDPDLPTLKKPLGKPFMVRNIYCDFKRHDLGPAFYERNFDGTMQKEFMTEPLWGVGSTAPYGHDGRSINLEEVVLRHGGEAKRSKDRFALLPPHEQGAVLRFLESLVLFGPPDTASNLDEADPSHPDYPQHGHGSIDLSALFNDPAEKE